MKKLVYKKGYSNKPLTELQKLFNKKKSRVRSRVEHVLSFMESYMNRIYLQNIGKSRIGCIVSLVNFTYNHMCPQ